MSNRKNKHVLRTFSWDQFGLSSWVGPVNNCVVRRGRWAFLLTRCAPATERCFCSAPPHADSNTTVDGDVIQGRPGPGAVHRCRTALPASSGVPVSSPISQGFYSALLVPEGRCAQVPLAGDSARLHHACAGCHLPGSLRCVHASGRRYIWVRVQSSLAVGNSGSPAAGPLALGRVLQRAQSPPPSPLLLRSCRLFNASVNIFVSSRTGLIPAGWSFELYNPLYAGPVPPVSPGTVWNAEVRGLG